MRFEFTVQLPVFKITEITIQAIMENQSKTTVRPPDGRLSATSRKALEASAIQLITQRILSKGGKMPNEKAVIVSARLLAARAMRARNA